MSDSWAETYKLLKIYKAEMWVRLWWVYQVIGVPALLTIQFYEELCNTSAQGSDGSFESQTQHMKSVYRANIPLHQHLPPSRFSDEWFDIQSVQNSARITQKIISISIPPCRTQLPVTHSCSGTKKTNFQHQKRRIKARNILKCDCFSV